MKKTFILLLTFAVSQGFAEDKKKSPEAKEEMRRQQLNKVHEIKLPSPESLPKSEPVQKIDTSKGGPARGNSDELARNADTQKRSSFKNEEINKKQPKGNGTPTNTFTNTYEKSAGNENLEVNKSNENLDQVLKKPSKSPTASRPIRVESESTKQNENDSEKEKILKEFGKKEEQK